jgi:hypothetical protein
MESCGLTLLVLPFTTAAVGSSMLPLLVNFANVGRGPSKKYHVGIAKHQYFFVLAQINCLVGIWLNKLGDGRSDRNRHSILYTLYSIHHIVRQSSTDAPYRFLVIWKNRLLFVALDSQGA